MRQVGHRRINPSKRQGIGPSLANLHTETNTKIPPRTNNQVCIFVLVFSELQNITYIMKIEMKETDMLLLYETGNAE